MKRVSAIIKDKTSSWTEEFDIPTGEDPKSYIERMLESFNNTLKPYETKRSLVKLKFEHDFIPGDLSDEGLLRAFLAEKPNCLRGVRRRFLDEVMSESAHAIFKAYEKNRLHEINRMMDQYDGSLATEKMKLIVREMVKRGYPNNLTRRTKKLK